MQLLMLEHGYPQGRPTLISSNMTLDYAFFIAQTLSNVNLDHAFFFVVANKA